MELAETFAWLRSMKWDWFVTLAGRPNFTGSEPAIRNETQQWLDTVRAVKPGAYAVVVVEQGAHFNGWHSHLLVGGIGTHPQWPEVLANLWHLGHAHVVRYDPEKDPKNDLRHGVVPYIHKAADVDLIGSPKRWRQRTPRTRAQPSL